MDRGLADLGKPLRSVESIGRRVRRIAVDLADDDVVARLAGASEQIGVEPTGEAVPARRSGGV
jgi:hypothetical protein